MKKMCVILACTATLVGANAERAVAIEPFLKEFMAKHVTNSGNEKFIAAATTTKCAICHVPGPNKKQRNAYGTELAKLIKKADKNNPKKIQDALDMVSGMKSGPANGDSPTWAELFKSGKLP